MLCDTECEVVSTTIAISVVALSLTGALIIFVSRVENITIISTVPYSLGSVLAEAPTTLVRSASSLS